MRQDISPCEGEIKRHGHLRIGSYNQHSEEVLDLEKCPLDFFADLYPQGITTTQVSFFFTFIKTVYMCIIYK
jgi:hypothetical protein